LKWFDLPAEASAQAGAFLSSLRNMAFSAKYRFTGFDVLGKEVHHKILYDFN
jgi:hypothetical protein